MKHKISITFIIIGMFLLAQIIGLVVLSIYSPQQTQVTDSSGNLTNKTIYNLPSGFEPPEDTEPQANLISIIIAVVIAAAIILFLMKFRAALFLRLWFFLVVIIALFLALNAFFIKLPYAPLLALLVAIPLAIFKVFRRSIIIHNFTEVLIYPGIAAIFVPLLNIWTTAILLLVISIYDIYAVWHAGFMQKMAKYQMDTVKVFGGFMIPYLTKAQKKKVKSLKDLKKSDFKKFAKTQKMKVPTAILGGGDVVFPLILAGVVLHTWGLLSASLVIIGSTLALTYLLFNSEKSKFYPAMPYITTGSLLGLGLAYLIRVI